jgi:ABC-type nitrate/sulfonate/bicarbonate transport system permease component
MPRLFWMSALRYLISILLLLIAWDLLIRISGLPPYVLPSPATVFVTLTKEFRWFAGHAISTLTNVAVGGTIGIGSGIAIGTTIAYSRMLRWLAEPYLVIFQSFPREALIPVIVIWFGFGATPKIANSALLSFFPMALITINALLDTRAEYLELVRNLGATKLQEFLYCRLPSAAYSITGGLKIAVPLALIGGVLGEFMGGNVGLGHVIISAGASFRMDRSFAAIVLLATIGMGVLACIRFFQETALRRFKQE